MKLTPKQEKILKWLGIHGRDIGHTAYVIDYYLHMGTGIVARVLNELVLAKLVVRISTGDKHEYKPTQAGIDLLEGLEDE